MQNFDETNIDNSKIIKENCIIKNNDNIKEIDIGDNNLINQKEDISDNIESKYFKNLPRIPLAKVKNITKLDNDVRLCQKNVYVALAKASELLIKDLADKAKLITKYNKRRTMNAEDIYSAAIRIPEYEFIDFLSLFPKSQTEDITKKEEEFEKKYNKVVNQLDNKKHKEKSTSKNNDNKIKINDKKIKDSNNNNRKSNTLKVSNNMNISSMFKNIDNDKNKLNIKYEDL